MSVSMVMCTKSLRPLHILIGAANATLHTQKHSWRLKGEVRTEQKVSNTHALNISCSKYQQEKQRQLQLPTMLAVVSQVSSDCVLELLLRICQRELESYLEIERNRLGFEEPFTFEGVVDVPFPSTSNSSSSWLSVFPP